MPEYGGRFRWDQNDALYVTMFPAAFLNVWLHRPVAEYQDTQALGAGPVNFNHTVAANTERLQYVGIHFSGAVIQTATVTIIYAGAATHNVVIDTTAFVNATDYFFIPDNDLIIEGLDGITVGCTNVGPPAINAFTTISMEELI